MACGRGAAATGALLCVLVAVLNGRVPSAAAQFVIKMNYSEACPTDQYFLTSLEEIHPAYAPLSGIYSGVGGVASGASYRHELGHAVLRRYDDKEGSYSPYPVYIGENTAGSSAVSLPAAGPLVEGDPASPRAYLRSTALQGGSWQVWMDGSWQPAPVLPDAKNAVCDDMLRLSCVTDAWRCPAGRLRVSGMPFGAASPAPSGSSLLGAKLPIFSKEPVEDDDPTMSTVAQFPMTSASYGKNMDADDDASKVHLGTFLITNEMHLGRPVYRKTGDDYKTFLYFDREKTRDGRTLPLWIVGPEPSQVDMDKSRMFFVVDAAARPEEITGCWRYRFGGQEQLAHLNITCEHGVEPQSPANMADCDFELPGACGYRVTKGRLTQQPYSEDELGAVSAAGDSYPGSFFAQAEPGDEAVVELLSPPFEAASNSCISFDYSMRTDAFFRCRFSLVSEAGDSSTAILIMNSAYRDWMRIRRSVPEGRYRLKVQTGQLAESDRLQIDSVRVTPGSCLEAEGTPSVCGHQPCAHGGTCVPTGATTYTCLCLGKEYQGLNCGPSRPAPCSPPSRTEHDKDEEDDDDDALSTDRSFWCRSGSEDDGAGGGAAGQVASKGLTTAAGLLLLALAAIRATQ